MEKDNVKKVLDEIFKECKNISINGMRNYEWRISNKYGGKVDWRKVKRIMDKINIKYKEDKEMSDEGKRMWKVINFEYNK